MYINRKYFHTTLPYLLIVCLTLSSSMAECVRAESVPDSVPLDLSQIAQWLGRNKTTVTTTEAQNVIGSTYQFEKSVLQTQVAERQLKNAKYSLLPSLDLSTSHGLQNNLSIGGNNTLLQSSTTAPWYSSLNLTLSEKFYDNGQTLFQIDAQSLRLQIATLEKEQTRQKQLKDFLKLYFDLILNEQTRRVRQDQAEQLSKRKILWERQWHEGVRTAQDYLRIDVESGRADLDLLQLHLEKNRLLQQLQQQVPAVAAWNSVTVNDRLLEIFAKRFNNREQLMHLVKVSDSANERQEARYQKSLEWQLAHLQQQNFEIDPKIERRKYWPNIDLVGSMSYTNLNYINSPEAFSQAARTSYSLLLNISFNIFDWGLRSRNIEMADLNLRIHIVDLQQQRERVRLALDFEYARLKQVLASYDLQNRVLETQGRTLKLIETNYREGRASYIDLISEWNRLADGRVRLNGFRLDFLNSIAEIKYNEGAFDDYFEFLQSLERQ